MFRSRTPAAALQPIQRIMESIIEVRSTARRQHKKKRTAKGIYNSPPDRREKGEPANFLPTLDINIQLRLKSLNQSAHVVVKRCKPHINPVPERQFFEFLGQLAYIRNRGAIHQNRNNRDIALKGHSNLNSDEYI